MMKFDVGDSRILRDSVMLWILNISPYLPCRFPPKPAPRRRIYSTSLMPAPAPGMPWKPPPPACWQKAALQHRAGFRRTLHTAVRKSRGALPAIRAPHRSGLRQHHRPDGRGTTGDKQRGCRLPDVGHAQHPRERRSAGSRLYDCRFERGVFQLIRQPVPNLA